jgi:hypothetical protein
LGVVGGTDLRVIGGTGLRAILILGNNRPVPLDSFFELLADVAGRLLRHTAGSKKKDRECQKDCAQPNHPNHIAQGVISANGSAFAERPICVTAGDWSRSGIRLSLRDAGPM